MKSVLFELQNEILSSQVVEEDGSKYIKSALGFVDCVLYTEEGIVYKKNGLTIKPPQPMEVLIRTTSVSLCGTDLGLIDQAHQGKLPQEAVGKVAGHEAAGFIVGIGKGVENWQIGQFVCLDSHFACSLQGHHHFDDCVESGLGCDGIVGGIRGSLDHDNHRTDPPNGYWSRVIVVPASALPLALDLKVVEPLKAPSTLESLGNIYMMVVKMKEIGLLDNPKKTLCVVSGLGATGYPMATIASHYGFKVVGINPSQWKRDFAMKQGACQKTFSNILDSEAELAGFDQVVVIVTADHPSAHLDALQFLNQSAKNLDKKIGIIFGLFADPLEPMPGAPNEFAKMPQRDFVFSRHKYTTSENVEVYGVCGRNLEAWQMLYQDLQPEKNGSPPKLVAMLNEAQYQEESQDGLQVIAQTLNLGSKYVQELLNKNSSLKLVSNLITQ